MRRPRFIGFNAQKVAITRKKKNVIANACARFSLGRSTHPLRSSFGSFICLAMPPRDRSFAFSGIWQPLV
jgi:hypothetical protein